MLCFQINGGDIAIKDNDGNTALIITINEGHFEVFELLKKLIFEAKEKKRNENCTTEIECTGPIVKLNHLTYNMDCASPYYVNITRRKQKPTAQHQNQNQNEPAVVEEQANIFQLNQSNLEQFQKMNQSLSKKSLVHTWKDKLVNTEINYEEMVKEFDNLKLSSTKLPIEFELDLSNEITNNFANIKASSTKLPEEVAADLGYDSFHTAKSKNDSSVSETSFIKSPNRLANDDDAENQVQLVEDYRHEDRENGLVFYERKIEPCLRYNFFVISSNFGKKIICFSLVEPIKPNLRQQPHLNSLFHQNTIPLIFAVS